MRKMFLLSSLFSLALIFSCKKENSVDLMDHTEVRGRLLDASTGEPIEGGTVYLVQGAGWVIFDSVVTAANGEYAFVYDHVLNSHADIWAKAPNYLSNRNIATWSAQYPNGGATSRDFVRENGRVNHQDVRLPPVGYVKYCFIKDSGSSANFRVNLMPYNLRDRYPVAGPGLDDCHTFQYPSGVDYRIVYAIFKDGQLFKTVEDTAYIPRFDTLVYNIHL